MKRRTMVQAMIGLGAALCVAGLSMWSALNIDRAGSLPTVLAAARTEPEAARWSTGLRVAEPSGTVAGVAGFEDDAVSASLETKGKPNTRGFGSGELAALSTELGLSVSQKKKAQTILDVLRRSEAMIELQPDSARRARALERLEAQAQRALGAIVSGEQQASLDRHFAARVRPPAP